MTEDERFEQLWATLKEQVKAARGYASITQTMGNSMDRNNVRFALTAPSEKFDPEAPFLHLSTANSTITAKVASHGLMSIAATTIAAYMDIEDKQPK